MVLAYGIRLHVWGEYACFTRPEMKVERVSYDVMTPSAARGVLEAIHWKPAIRWEIDRIHVLKPIRFETLRRNELGRKIPASSARKAMKGGSTDGLATLIGEHRQQRASTLLRDVAYVIESHFTLAGTAGPSDTEARHLAMFNRRAAKGQCFHRPYLGTREFAAHFALVTGAMPESALLPEEKDRDLGWMLFDVDYGTKLPRPQFFRARLRDGVLDVPKPGTDEIRS